MEAIAAAKALFCALVLSLTPQEQEPKARNRQGYVSPAGGHLHLPGIPAPIQEPDMARWSWLIGLSESQEALWLTFYRNYSEREPGVYARFVQPLWDRSAQIADAGAPERSVAVAQDFERLLKRDRPPAVQQLVALEEQLFAELPPFLTDEQLVRLEIAKAQRKRERINTTPSLFPGVQLDLVSLLHQIASRAGDEPVVNDWPTCVNVLTEYSSGMTSRVEGRLDALISSMCDVALSFAQRREGAIATNDATLADETRIRRAVVKAERDMLEFNLRFIERVRPLLTEDATAAIDKAVQRTVRAVYPDPTELHSQVAKIRDCAGLSEPQVEQVEQLVAEAERQRRETCRAMEKTYLDWREFHLGEGRTPPEEAIAYEKTMNELHARRIEIALKAVQQIKETYATVATGCAAQIETLERGLREFKYNPLTNGG